MNIEYILFIGTLSSIEKIEFQNEVKVKMPIILESNQDNISGYERKSNNIFILTPAEFLKRDFKRAEIAGMIRVIKEVAVRNGDVLITLEKDEILSLNELISNDLDCSLESKLLVS